MCEKGLKLKVLFLGDVQSVAKLNLQVVGIANSNLGSTSFDVGARLEIG